MGNICGIPEEQEDISDISREREQRVGRGNHAIIVGSYQSNTSRKGPSPPQNDNEFKDFEEYGSIQININNNKSIILTYTYIYYTT